MGLMDTSPRFARSRLLALLLGTALIPHLAGGLRAQSCEADTGAGGGTEGAACVETAAMVAFDNISTAFLQDYSRPLFAGETLVHSLVTEAPASTSTSTDVRAALDLVNNGGLVLATGGEFRQTVGLIRTPGFDTRHPLQIGIGYRSYEVDAWRVLGDPVGTTDDPFGPGWRASWGDMLVAPSENGGPVMRIDEHGPTEKSRRWKWRSGRKTR